MREQWGLVLVAVQALTRAPVPAPYGPNMLRAAVRYFPLVGVGVGLLAAGVFAVARGGLPGVAAAGLSLAATLLLTGGLHEDGLADCADGLFGGRTRADALRIMRDSRVGAFGVLALVVVVGLKLSAVGALDSAWALVAGHAAGRFWAVIPAAVLPYARDEGMAGGVGAPSLGDVGIAAGFGLLPLVLLGDRALVAALVSGAVAAGMVWWARRRLAGYTGDVLGATQVLTEVSILLVAAWQPA